MLLLLLWVRRDWEQLNLSITQHNTLWSEFRQLDDSGARIVRTSALCKPSKDQERHIHVYAVTRVPAVVGHARVEVTVNAAEPSVRCTCDVYNKRYLCRHIFCVIQLLEEKDRPPELLFDWIGRGNRLAGLVGHTRWRGEDKSAAASSNLADGVPPDAREDPELSCWSERDRDIPRVGIAPPASGDAPATGDGDGSTSENAPVAAAVAKLRAAPECSYCLQHRRERATSNYMRGASLSRWACAPIEVVCVFARRMPYGVTVSHGYM